MDAAVGDVRACGAVEGDHDGQRPGALAVGAFVVGVGVLDPVVAVGVDLRDARHALGAQVLPRPADGLCRDDVVPAPQEGIRDDHGRRDIDFGVAGQAGVAVLVDAEAVEVGDALDAGLMLFEQIEQALPDSIRDADFGAHAAPAVRDGPA